MQQRVPAKELVRSDSGHPEGAAGFEGEGVEVSLDTDGLVQLEGTWTVVESLGAPREVPVTADRLRELVGGLER